MKKVYDKIFELLNRHKEDVNFDVDDLKRRADLHLFGLELKEKYGLNIDPKDIYNKGWQRLSDYRRICHWDKKRQRIPWPDDGKQPGNEMLFLLEFSSGAYIFGSTHNSDYPTELFDKFWQELKSFNPDYIDTQNHSLYWKIENAKDIFNSFNSILQKYREINKTDSKKRQIERLQKQLKDLEQ